MTDTDAPKMPPNVRVRELPWGDDDCAPSVCGQYGLRCDYDDVSDEPIRFWFNRSEYPYHDECDERYPTAEAAKAAAQADYEARILSALEVVEDDVRDVVVTDAMIDAGLEHYLEGDWIPLDEEDKREAVSNIIRAALTKGPTDDRT